ncbi:unnamed protein product [Arabidopsis lyrata]|nr:unnamed protein product [Arabidopsis lyrata]
MEDESKIVPKLPILGKRNILITSALPYVNNVPHLGNIIGCVLSADVYARYCRLRGYNTIYICGTDEYGTATETKALEENCTPKEICDKYHAIHQVYDWFDISFDKFGRTSTPETKVCQEIFNKLWENEWISEDTMKQPYCDTCKKFLADRLVEDPRCKVCKTTPGFRDTDHLFLELPLLKYKLKKYIKETSSSGSWSRNAIQTTDASLKEVPNDSEKDGLKKRCITRDLKWGVPVPHEKYKEKVFYVWFDAPIGYVSITSCYTSEWEKWWKNPENVELYQFMGKDNVFFHTVLFPCTHLGTGEDWTMMKTVSVTDYLNYEGGKFSESKGVGVFGNDVKDTNIPVEVWRYYLLTNRPEKRLWVYPDATDPESHDFTRSLAEYAGKLVEDYVKVMEKVKLKKGLHTTMLLSNEGNTYLQDTNFWELYKKDKPSCAVVIRTAAGLVHLLARLLEPFMPSFSREVFKQLNLPPHFSLSEEKGEVLQASSLWEILPSNHRIGTPQPLFKKMEEEEMKHYREKFAGSQADRLARDREITMARLDIRVGKIVKAEKHPKADALYVEEIDVGEDQLYTVVSGLVKYIPLEEMQNRLVCVLCNLKPAKMREIVSQGMVLATSSSDGSKVELVEPPESSKIGERVKIPGFEGEPDNVLNPKTKIWEKLVVDLHTNENLVACYKNLPFTTSAGECKVSSISNGTIR